MAQIERTGYINYPFKGKMRVDPKTLKAYNFLSFSISPLSRKANILAYNRPQYLTATNGTRPTDGANVHGRVRLLRGGGVTHGAEIRRCAVPGDCFGCKTAAPWFCICVGWA
ncbi:hypothetical protein F383_36993 [Gossypium arboreum]|uniref:Uncharacterized protein n=1 Tax=Gossypium arboreum TaxID=29729 RepID=A0A0B0MBP0_GOSAR|nr:hypothetical protein F383_36993 [Gossypium arboreum]